jgi:hypothetical protein
MKALKGKTYDIKDYLKIKFESTWDDEARALFVPDNLYDEAQQFVTEFNAAQKSARRESELEEAEQYIKDKLKLNTVRNPTFKEMKFIENCFWDVLNGNLLLANKVHDFRNIADKYRDYFKLREWPDDIRNINCQRRIKDLKNKGRLF